MTPPSGQTDCWDGITHGDMCKVEGRANRPYRFMYARATDRGVSLTLYGPLRGDGQAAEHRQQFIAVEPERVSRWRSKGKRR